jgi:hypothetical protein
VARIPSGVKSRILTHACSERALRRSHRTRLVY